MRPMPLTRPASLTLVELLNNMELRYLENVIEKYKEHRKSNIISNCEYLNFVFLCGGDKNRYESRSIIHAFLEKKRRDIKILYSEDLYKILDSFDLLTFEELLADLSSNIVIIVESFGSACELGAFSYFEETLKKLIVINNRKHKNSDSFINHGPIRKVENISKKNVIYCEFIRSNDMNHSETIILDSDLARNLDELISYKRSFKGNDLRIEENTLIIENLYILQLMILEVVKLFVTVNKESLIDIILKFYDVKYLRLIIKPNIDKVTSKSKDKDTVQKVINMIINLLSSIDIIKNTNDEITLNYKNEINQLLTDNEANSILIKSRFLKSKQYLKIKSKLINLYKKNGKNIWVQ